MDLRTIVKTDLSPFRISYRNPVLFLGSCFAAYIGERMKNGKMPVCINPSGTVYNPVSVDNTLEMITSGRKLLMADLYNHNGNWLSFDHYTEFSSENPDEVLERINTRTAEASAFLSGQGFLFITFGTARVYRWKRTGKVVSNCHRIPAAEFSSELLPVEDIVATWNKRLDMLASNFPGLKVVFTISPVRHWKDGAHGNQVSKSVLFLATEKLLAHPSSPAYFPAYEILMDDLRDYRFYDNDMLHPSGQAVDYIWNVFAESYMDEKTRQQWKEISSVTRAMEHRINTSSSAGVRKFVAGMLSKIDSIGQKYPGTDLSAERAWFNGLIGH
ncbi:MAG: GSCFA domain-containing protein [Bacteroidales bacterium]|jgi:hypothetical protein|nr:GSCFA domain-containing protein [Bacteroidales bacterium]